MLSTNWFSGRLPSERVPCAAESKGCGGLVSYAVRLLGAACALIGFAFFAPVLAQTRDAASGYPVRAVRIVVPFGAGGVCFSAFYRVFGST